ncbi:hypothetical protein P879_06313, partial [Paragonimus westermani]
FLQNVRLYYFDHFVNASHGLIRVVHLTVLCYLRGFDTNCLAFETFEDGAVSPNVTEKAVLYEAEGFALAMLCHCRTIARRLALHILRKCRSLLNQINLAKSDPLTRHTRSPHELCCIDVLDRCVPIMLRRVLPLLPPNERGLLFSS